MIELTASHYAGQRVAVGLSGGTDSAFTAFKLKEAGAEVVAITMCLVTDGWDPQTEPRMERARQVARRVGVAHHVLDFSERFDRAIVEPFVASYAAGQTPSPCCRCNPLVKFGLLLDAALEMGCDSLATGHYVRLMVDDSGVRSLQRGRDAKKDQSYFLFGLSREQLSRACFPLGAWEKPEVKERVAEHGFVPPCTSESQDLCFVKEDDYASLVTCRLPELAEPGMIVDGQGRVLGSHEGFFRYTIGQRQGLGLSGGPWYVTALHPERNEVVVGEEEDLYTRTVRIGSVNWQGPGSVAESASGSAVQFRYRMKPVEVSRVRALGNGVFDVDLASPVRAVAPGQAAVFFDEDCLLGGGWIKGSIKGR